MNAPAFENPVPILLGAGFLHHVQTPFDAYRILREWDGRKGPAHVAALNACKAAMRGEIEPETARGIFHAFAKTHGILAPLVRPRMARAFGEARA